MQNPVSSFHPVQAILFDLDGTLVHSTLNFAQIRRDIGCPEGQDVLGFVEALPETEKHLAERIIQEHELTDAYATRVVDGALELLARLHLAGIKTAIVTRNSLQATQIKLETCGIKVAHVLTREDAPPKPDPQALLLLSQLWDMAPQTCVYVGDYLYDLQAANNAGMHACLYHRTGSGETVLPGFAHLADFICHDFDQFERVLLSYLKVQSVQQDCR